MQEIIIDSKISLEEALRQNPQNPAPEKVLASLGLLDVRYLGFDGFVHQGQIVMDKSLLEEVGTFFERAFSMQFPIEKVVPISQYGWNDEMSCSANNTAGYNYRPIAGTNTMSKHARGRAFDLNPYQNVYIKYDRELKEIFRFPPGVEYSPAAKGALHSGHELVLFMKDLGWTWGGDWTPESGRTDYQHFEK